MEGLDINSLEEEALKRKKRLENLKRKAENEKDTHKDNLKPKFRSYKPLDKTLKEDSQEENGKDTGIEEQIQDQLELLKTPITIDEIDITNLAPRKQDWDLKRDISKKLEKLEWLTQKAIAELIRERLKMNQESIFEAVATAELQSEKSDLKQS
ncbi:coiled-coil domain-containing protein 12 [Condylostylus longicornis]|uniref:coiled-coil domain-containing protein 12 n=1 Tax=Condylostylus longicornis TaxID=2530218 RepID=UPI00244E3757|nr:coiled-coil domain-containing protein 12 [Condylostylus longicornis]